MSYEFNPFTRKLDKTGIGVEDAYFLENGDTLELWWNNTLVHSWTVTSTGSPIGLLLVLTKS